MGGGTYSTRASICADTGATMYARKSVTRDAMYSNSTREEIFHRRDMDAEMDPKGVLVREARDSDEHPESIAIIIALDVTGSMMDVPYEMIKTGLPNIMGKIIDAGIADPQVLFMAIGDHECDFAPLQIGQFESSDELLDKWLSMAWLEGHGGGNAGESYHLAWFFASRYTAIDCLEKRGQKGILFTIGDEPTLRHLDDASQKAIMGPGQYSTLTASQLLAEAREKYEVFHIHISETPAGRRRATVDSWRQLLGGNLLMAQSRRDVAEIIAGKIVDSVVAGTVERKAEILEDMIKPTPVEAVDTVAAPESASKPDEGIML